MYRPTIGLEIHAELTTQTKMFCDCANDPDETRPNINVCPICMAHPGTLPVMNRAAIQHIMRVGSALGSVHPNFSEFDRKSYFYPDIPKGYQISQYAHPLVTGGSLAGVAITRVHIEEDTARSIHAESGSLIDFNRAGVPLMELVTEPVIRDSQTAGNFARELQLLLRTIGASEANLEKGEMRIEANVSVSNEDGTFGTKVEIKNLNSFRSVERAISFEIKRHIAMLSGGEKVIQETRGWDEIKQKTFHQRFKEGSADYRYFPEPDLPKIFLSEIRDFSAETLQASLPELPWERRARYARTYVLKESDVAYLCATPERAAFFDSVAAALGNGTKLVALAANYIISDLAGIYAKKDIDGLSIDGNSFAAKLDPSAFAKLIRLISSRSLSSRGAKDTLLILVEQGGDPEEIAKEHGFIQSHDTKALREIVRSVLKKEARAVEEYSTGKEAALQYLIGKSMGAASGAGNPAVIKDLIIEEIK